VEKGLTRDTSIIYKVYDCVYFTTEDQVTKPQTVSILFLKVKAERSYWSPFFSFNSRRERDRLAIPGDVCSYKSLLKIFCLNRNKRKIHRLHRTSPLRAQQVNAIYRFVAMVY
jgi:hypothetical protein